MEYDYLKVISEEIDKKLDLLYEDAQNRLIEIDSKLEKFNEEYKIAKADGDLRENAAFEDAIKNIQGAQGDRQRWEVLSDGIVNVKGKLVDYVRQSRITVLSTVHLKKVASNKRNRNEVIDDIEDEFIFKLFPYGISDIDNRILSVDSTIGASLLDKGVGDDIKFRDKSSGHYAYFKIVGFY